jgi:PHS family inorganic phosphate transporter-like MFS transporter
LVPLVSSVTQQIPPVADHASDIAFYGINLNQTVILKRIGYGKGATPFETLHNTAVGNIIVQSAGYLPGYWIGIFLPDRVGRIRLQFYGSLLVAAIYAIWAGITNHTNTAGLTAIFAVSQIVLNSTVNVTTFLLPVEVFPTRVRGTAHGIAAACGKVGAIITAMSFGIVNEKIGIQGNLGLFAGIMVLAALCTLWIPETKGKTIEEIEHGVLYGQSMDESADLEEDASSIPPESIHVAPEDGKNGEQA